MTIEISVLSDVKRYAGNLEIWRKKTTPAERRCLQKKIIDGAHKDALAVAKKIGPKANPRQRRTAIVKEVRNAQLRNDRGQFTSAYGRIYINVQRNNRTSQVLNMMAKGGHVRVGSPRMQGMTIVKDRGYDVRAIRRIIDFARAQGTYRPSKSGGGVYYAPEVNGVGFNVMVNRRGYYVFQSHGRKGKNRNGELIAFLPRQATYRRQFKFEAIMRDHIRQNIGRYHAECVAVGTRRILNKKSGISGTGF